MKYLITIVFLITGAAQAQTIDLKVDFNLMKINRLGLFLWQQEREPATCWLNLPEGPTSGECYIDPTYVRGGSFKTIDQCYLRGLLSAGEFTITLPPEAVTPWGTARPIWMHGLFTEWGGKEWRLEAYCPRCPTRLVPGTRLQQRMAPPVRSLGKGVYP